MVKLINNIALRVFEKQNIESIHDIYKSLLDLDYQKEKIEIKDEKVEDIDHNQFSIVRVVFSKQRHTKLLWELLMSKMSDQDKQKVKSQISSRVDDDGLFYLRFEKQGFLQGQYVLTESGNCFHFTINVAAFPKNKENAVKVVEELLS